MRIKKVHLRHYPPGLQLEFTDGKRYNITLSRELITYLSIDTIYTTTERLIASEAMLQSRSTSRQEKITSLVVKSLTALLNTKKYHSDSINEKKFKCSRVLKAHVLPLTNVAFNKSGSLCLTGSYDRTAKIWKVDQDDSDQKPITLEGHKNVVYTVSFNNPFGDKVATGSFDRLAKIWSTETGECLQTLKGHSAEVVTLGFNSSPHQDNKLLATGSMDCRCGLWKIEDGSDMSEPVHWLAGHF